MKRKILIALLSATATVCCALGLAACDKTEADKSVQEITNVTQAYNIATELGYDGTLEQFIAALRGKDGLDVINGKDGADGVGVKNISKTANGELIVELTDLTQVNLGKINGENGTDGVGIIKAELNANGEVVFTYSDGRQQNIDKIPDCAHKYGDWSVALEETCTSIGYSLRTCSLCGYKDYKFARATGHSFVYTATIKQPDCVLDGVKLLSCIECGTVKSEAIPANGHSFENGVCGDCGLTEFSQGLEYALNSDGTYYIVTGIGTCTDTELRIPEEYNGLPVKEVKGLAFARLEDIVSVNIPRTITFMGRFAFGYLKSLEKVYYNATNCVDLADWGADVFMNSGEEKGLTVTAGKDVEHIPANLFNFKQSSSRNNCFVKQLTVEDGSVCRSIGRRAFYYANITELVLPDSIEIIGDGAFRGCKILKKVMLGNNVKEIGEQAFYYCDNLAEINIPDSIIKLGSMFVNDESKVMKYNEYDDCLYLGNETNPYVVLMEIKVNKKHYTIHKDTKVIYDYVFLRSSIEELVIPEGVVTVGRAFGSCYNLKTISIPASVTSFNGTLNGSRAFEKFIVAEDNPVYYCKNNCLIDRTTKTIIAGWDASIIPSDGSVTAIGDYAFRDCESQYFTNLVIPDNITYIGKGAFSECDYLENIVLPQKLEYLGNFAFRDCRKLKSITLPEGITEIRTQMFMNCDNLESVTFLGKITSIESGAFESCDSLKTFTFPEGIKEIKDYVLAYSHALETVVIPAGVEKIDMSAFYQCKNLKILFKGSEKEWNTIKIIDRDTVEYTVYFYTETSEHGWHYKDGEIVIW